MHIHPKISRLFFAACFGLIGYGAAQSMTLRWNPVEADDLEGYAIHRGTESGMYTATYDVGDVLQYDFPDLTPGCVYYFTVTAYDKWGNESGFSPEIEHFVSGDPNDVTPPGLAGVEALSRDRIRLRFNEPVGEQSAQTPANYAIYPDIQVLEAVLEENASEVTLTTSAHRSGDYLITVSNVVDRAAVPNRIPDNTSLGYSFDATAVTGRTGRDPSDFSLSQNFPNPFNPTTTIEYSVKEPGHVRLRIYNVRGELVKTLIDRDVSSVGRQPSVVWDASDERGMQVSSGFYVYRLESEGRVSSRRMQLVR